MDTSVPVTSSNQTGNISTVGESCDLVLQANSLDKLSLSTLVLNSRDWSEIVWLPGISRFKISLAISFI